MTQNLSGTGRRMLRQVRHRTNLFYRRCLSRYLRLIFWISVLAVLVVAILALFFDAKSDVISCQPPNPLESAYLVLSEIESNTRTMKTALLIPRFDRSKHQLILGTSTASSGLTKFSYDPRITLKPNGQTTDPTGSVEVSLPYKSSSFWYPFDHSKLDLLIDYKLGESQIPLRVRIENRINGLILEPCDSHYSVEDAKSGITTNRFSISLRRHRFVQVIALTFLIVALTFLFYIAKREEKNKVLSSSLGYIAALWGIRQILMGPEKLFPTIVDFLTLGLYIAVAVIVFHKLLFGKEVLSK
jgi:hypothetical protein